VGSKCSSWSIDISIDRDSLSAFGTQPPVAYRRVFVHSWLGSSDRLGNAKLFGHGGQDA
jgi:hypothetical protein